MGAGAALGPKTKPNEPAAEGTGPPPLTFSAGIVGVGVDVWRNYSRTVKVRIGFGLAGAADAHDGATLAAIVDTLEALGFDSLWFTERVNSPTLDPLVAMTFALARTEKLKVGTSVMVLPGRNPVLLAKALASMHRLSGGRVLPALGLGVANAAEQQAFGVLRNKRAAIFDEAMTLMRRLWSEDDVSFRGEHFSVEHVTVEPKPIGNHIDVWLGGAAKAELVRCGRLGDGWLPSFSGPATVAAGIATVNEAAQAAGRRIDPEHFGVLIPYLDGPIPDALRAVVAAREPNLRAEDVIASSRAQMVDLIHAYIAVGASKFVVLPFAPPPKGWTTELEVLATLLKPLEL